MSVNWVDIPIIALGLVRTKPLYEPKACIVNWCHRNKLQSILIVTDKVSFKKKLSSGKWQLSCLGLNMFRVIFSMISDDLSYYWWLIWGHEANISFDILPSEECKFPCVWHNTINPHVDICIATQWVIRIRQILIVAVHNVFPFNMTLDRPAVLIVYLSCGQNELHPCHVSSISPHIIGDSRMFVWQLIRFDNKLLGHRYQIVTTRTMRIPCE